MLLPTRMILGSTPLTRLISRAMAAVLLESTSERVVMLPQLDMHRTEGSARSLAKKSSQNHSKPSSLDEAPDPPRLTTSTRCSARTTPVPRHTRSADPAFLQA